VSHPHVEEAKDILKALKMPRRQVNDRTAICLLALLDLRPTETWDEVKMPLIGITPIMDWGRDNYDRSYKPNSRESFRRQSVHQFEAAGIVVKNPDNPLRPTNSDKTVYQVSPEAYALLRTYGSPEWQRNLAGFLDAHPGLAERYARARNMKLVPIEVDGKVIELSSDKHSVLIKDIIEQFAPRFAPGARLIYVGDARSKMGYFDVKALAALGVTVDPHGKIPDVILFDGKRNWLLLVEAVTSHGPVDGKRHEELRKMFGAAQAGLVFVTAFPTRQIMARYLREIAWETEAWTRETPDHLIHFNGERFLGPYE